MSIESLDAIRAAVARMALAVGPVTISAGLAEGSADLEPSHVLARADAALYLAKHEGRDRVAYHGVERGVRTHRVATTG